MLLIWSVRRSTMVVQEVPDITKKIYKFWVKYLYFPTYALFTGKKVAEYLGEY